MVTSHESVLLLVNSDSIPVFLSEIESNHTKSPKYIVLILFVAPTLSPSNVRIRMDTSKIDRN